MNIKKHTYIILSALAFTACSHDDNSAPTYTVGDADNAIVLSAGIAEGPSSVSSRAGVEANHAKHVAFQEGTKLSIRVDGTWTGKADGYAPHGTISGGTVSQTTTATIGAETVTDSKYNPLSMSPQLYWDDYGTADPDNMGEGKGRKKGLTIYAAAVDGKTDAAPTIDGASGKTWTALSWTLDANQQANDWKNKDLLTSNNIKDGNRFTFANAIATTKTNNILEFTHAMSKVTVNLTAGAGFVDGKFKNKPSVTLLDFNYKGTVSIEEKTSSPTSGTANIEASINKGATWTSAHTAQATAIVFPGNQFADANDIIKINCDGNIYYVNATKINDANTAEGDIFEQGKNYIFNITVNKTKIEVTATIKDWVDVTAETDEPVINVTTAITGTSQKNDAFTSFDFYLSDNSASSPATSYEKKGTPTGTKTDGTEAWTFTSPLYWPSHSTHYHMRGVYPTETTVTNGKIAVTNGAYLSTSFPSNLLVGAPEFTDANKYCDNPDHASVDMSAYGVCARKANINLMFSYMMSQIEVRLSTTTGADKVNLTDAKVEIINGYTAGNIDIHTKTAAVSGDKNNFEVKYIDGEDGNYRHSIVVPQTFTYSTEESQKDKNTRFKITVSNTDETTDVYYADIEPIKKYGSTTEKVAPNGKWESGVHYIYTFNMRKTEITVTATLTDWIPVEASEDVWF